VVFKIKILRLRNFLCKKAASVPQYISRRTESGLI
jgi:hypothetical protein